MTITATYSPEDNKLRLYASTRLDAETYARVKEAGFRWAPKQELFVAPAWSVKREDLAIELAGEIEAEESTMAERAEAKAERFEELAGKRSRQAGAYASAAHSISERFAMGQPILIGHHSERKARKDRDRADSMQRKAIEAEKSVGWWLYKASAAQHHANRKNASGVRARRIKKLLAELRDLQRSLNEAQLALATWAKLDTEEKIFAVAKVWRMTGTRAVPYSIEGDYSRGLMSPFELKAACVAYWSASINGSNRRRWIEHTLNRLSYERELLGEVLRYDGAVTPVMLQEFTREHGADSPKGALLPDGRLSVTSGAPLPAHIGDGCELTLTADEWRDLMQGCGYEAKAKAERKAKISSRTPPLLNLDVERIEGRSPYRSENDSFVVVRMTKAEHAKINKDAAFTRYSACGGFRFRTCPDPTWKGPYYSSPRVAVFLTDSKAHKLPKLEAAS